jgi:glyoxylase-like metal-dependent hydrolase (beta-lactamase superfamily II)
MNIFFALLSTASAETPITVHRLGWSFINVFALEGPEGVVIVDVHNEGSERKIMKRLDKAGIDRDRVRLVLLTHGHADHAGGGLALREALGVPLAVGAGDVGLLASGHVIPPKGKGATFQGKLLAPFIDHTYPPYAPDLTVSEPMTLDEYGVPADVRVVGGHTGGSLAVDLRDGRVLVGDLIRSGMTAPHRPRKHFYQTDREGARATLSEVLDGGATEIYPSHGGMLPAKRVRRFLDRHAR